MVGLDKEEPCLLRSFYGVLVSCSFSALKKTLVSGMPSQGVHKRYHLRDRLEHGAIVVAGHVTVWIIFLCLALFHLTYSLPGSSVWLQMTG